MTNHQQTDQSTPSIEISADGEPVFILPVEFAANDLIEVHVGDEAADVIIDGRLFCRTRRLTDTLRNWLVMAEEVALRPMNSDTDPMMYASAQYAPVYDCNSAIKRRV